MAALPYMQLYVADYLADTAHLTTEEHGAYLLLLFSYWQTGKPLRADRLASIARLDNERWTNVERTLKEFFHVSKSEWTHFRVESDLEKVESKSKKNSDAGKASAKAKALAKQIVESSESTNVVTNVVTNVEQTYQRKLNHTDTDTDTEKDQDQKTCPKTVVLDGFEDFWKIYPRKEAKKTALKAWAKIKPQPDLLQKILASVIYRSESVDWKKDGGKFVPLPATWLNQERYNDEIEPGSVMSAKAMSKIVAIYNEVCQSRFQPAVGMTDSRASALAAMWSIELEGHMVFRSPDGWTDYFSAALKTDFSWVAQDSINLDFLIAKNNIARIWECR